MDDAGVLESKRTATSYRILVEIAQRQPAVSQQEIADTVGVTPQAVSDYLQDLTGRGFVDKQGRGRYEITKEGVDWLISQTDGLRGFVDHVSGEVLDQVDIETAIAGTEIAEGERVALTMRDGVLHAVPDADESEGDGAGEPQEHTTRAERKHRGTDGATAIAVTDAVAGRDVGVTNFEGVIDYELGTVTVVAVPPVQDGGSSVVDAEHVAAIAADHDLVAVDAPEGLAAARVAGLDPDLRFGTAGAVRDAAVKGLDVLLLAPRDGLATHTDALREHNVSYEVLDPVDER
jgi:putative transcriptional regulator